MKITLTKKEMLNLLSATLNFTVDEFVVVSGSEMTRMIKSAVTQFDYRYSQKISAIKALRQVFCDNKDKWARDYGSEIFGLADAKWAIENFDQFIAFIEKEERFPKNGFYYGTLK